MYDTSVERTEVFFMIKRFTAVLMAVVLLTACGAKGTVPAPAESPVEGNRTEIRVAGLTGPTTMGMAKLLSDSEEQKTEGKYTFSLYGSADEVTPKLLKDEIDLAAVPANLASVLYNNTEGGIRLLAVNTLGVLYIVETGDSIHSAADLKGKTIYATGKGSTPEYTLRYILSENGIDPDQDVTVEFKSEPAEIVALMSGGKDVIAMLPQPYVEAAKAKVPDLRTALSLTEEWDRLGNGSQLITGVLVARKEFVSENKEACDLFLKEYASSIEWVKDHTEEASQLMEKYDIVKAAIAKKALPQCNLTYMGGEEMKNAVAGYLEILYGQNPKAVGGKMPGEDFYYLD